MRVVRTLGDARRRGRQGRGRGRVGVRRRHRLRRALRRARPPRRGAGRRRPARQRPGPRRARLLDPASSPEGRRGGARARHRRGRGRGDARRGAQGRRGDRVRRRRHRRVPLRRRARAVLLPGDEHPPPGRAPGHRGRHRHRPRRARSCASPRGAPSTCDVPRAAWSRHRGAALRRGPRPRLAAAERCADAVRGPGSRPPRSRCRRPTACGSTPASRPAARCPPTTTRCSPR